MAIMLFLYCSHNLVFEIVGTAVYKLILPCNRCGKDRKSEGGCLAILHPIKISCTRQNDTK